MTTVIVILIIIKMTIDSIVTNYLNKAICSTIGSLMHLIHTVGGEISNLIFHLLVLIKFIIRKVSNCLILNFLLKL